MEKQNARNTTPETIHVRISRATQAVWEGEARSVSSENSTGPFDILPMHANFISLVGKKPIKVTKEDGTVDTYTFNKSVIYVNKGVVTIYADIG
jgi:F0F1-type ATP synthase epsilon subunit